MMNHPQLIVNPWSKAQNPSFPGYLFILQGEFVFDEFHGQGMFRHVSGVVYDGLWINGFPAKMASKLHIIVEKTPLIIRQGTPFNYW